MGRKSEAEESLSVHLAGSDYLTVVGLRQLFEDSGFIDVAGFSASGTEAVERVKAEQPDVVLMDSMISNGGMPETIAALSKLTGHPRVVVLSTNGTAKAMEAAFKAGACGYLVRGPTLEDVAAALRIVHRGGCVSSITPARPQGAELNGHEGIDREALARFESLSIRDMEIVAATADGYTNTEISKRLHLSEATVKARLGQVMQQLGLNNRVQIAVAAVKAETARQRRAALS